MMQSRNTKNLNLDKDLDEILSKIKQTRWAESTRTKSFWTQNEEEINNRHSPGLTPRMESIMFFVAEWVSVKEMKALHSACMRTSTKAREQQYEELLSSWNDQEWKELSNDWQRCLRKKKKKVLPCEPKTNQIELPAQAR